MNNPEMTAINFNFKTDSHDFIVIIKDKHNDIICKTCELSPRATKFCAHVVGKPEDIDVRVTCKPEKVSKIEYDNMTIKRREF